MSLPSAPGEEGTGTHSRFPLHHFPQKVSPSPTLERKTQGPPNHCGIEDQLTCAQLRCFDWKDREQQACRRIEKNLLHFLAVSQSSSEENMDIGHSVLKAVSSQP
ncbi:hypothetical protein XELAEV_18044610mg [Xenopus laevis]|uniref:Uncharacterized protein n=1 Tax=Xenopus laevis TaxID=8355 RepID=A0A974H3F5_XENLA|nr:hypothetical protein XELAEV_18044610mg [Xenopus laevis]